MASETQAIRQARLAELKRQIAAGTYETPERLAVAVEALLAEQAWDGAEDAAAVADAADRSDTAGNPDATAIPDARHDAQQESCQSTPGPNLPR